MKKFLIFTSLFIFLGSATFAQAAKHKKHHKHHKHMMKDGKMMDKKMDDKKMDKMEKK